MARTFFPDRLHSLLSASSSSLVSAVLLLSFVFCCLEIENRTAIAALGSPFSCCLSLYGGTPITELCFRVHDFGRRDHSSSHVLFEHDHNTWAISSLIGSRENRRPWSASLIGLTESPHTMAVVGRRLASEREREGGRLA